jgi:hypothetical protein
MSEETTKPKRGPGRPKGSKNKKKVTLGSLHQTHGKDEAHEKKIRPTTLAQIWGDDGTDKYGTLDLGTYKSQISTMGRADLFRHATKLGMVPIDNLTLLRSRLEKEFQRHVLKYNAPPEDTGAPEKVPSDVQRILSEGK